MVRPLLVALGVGAGMLCPLPPAVAQDAGPDSLGDGIAVLQQMRARYAGAWYRTLAVIQSATYFDGKGGVERAEIWYRSLSLPGTVRSDVAPLADGRGELVRTDSVFRFSGDSLVECGPATHLLLLLGHDVYVEPVEVTAERLEELGFALGSVTAAAWEGVPVWVVGDSVGPRFWVERERRLLRRLELPASEDALERDIRLNGFEPVGRAWIPTDVVFRIDGQVRIHERSTWWQAEVALPASVFATVDRARPSWVGR